MFPCNITGHDLKEEELFSADPAFNRDWQNKQSYEFLATKEFYATVEMMAHEGQFLRFTGCHK